MFKALKAFHHCVARHIAGKMPRLEGDIWVYPPPDSALQDAGLCSIRECVHRCQATMTQCVATRRIPVSGWLSSRSVQWQQQDLIVAAADEAEVVAAGAVISESENDGFDVWQEWWLGSRQCSLWSCVPRWRQWLGEALSSS